MKITAIKQQVKNPDRASVFVDATYSFSLSLSELLDERLKNGQELTESDIKRLKKKSQDGKLRGRALEWVLNRPRSVRECKDYLRRKQVEPDQADAWIAEFQDRGYLSDRAFALWLADMRRRGGKSERIIRQELMGKGVARDIAAEAMQETIEAGSEMARLRTLIAKKSKLPRYTADRNKLIQYCLRQGFSYDDIKLALQDQQD